MELNEQEKLLQKLIACEECEWVEFKENCDSGLGEYISALSNAAAYYGRDEAYMVFGIENGSRAVRGTNLRLTNTTKVKILPLLSPQVKLDFYEVEYRGKRVVIVEVAAARVYPTKFKGRTYMRIESAKVDIARFPEYERELWKRLEQCKFETGIAKKCSSIAEVFRLLDVDAMFRMYRDFMSRDEMDNIEQMESRGIIKYKNGKYLITNLGAIMFARHLRDFNDLAGKQIRMITYQGDNNITPAVTDFDIDTGYALGFTTLVDTIYARLPKNEVIESSLRVETPLYPKVAIREFLANALIHQDFTMSGAGPMIEVYSNRMEITNPGIPLVETDRFIDHAPRSRNEKLAAAMRLVYICEERGSGIDRAICECEMYQLPAPKILRGEDYTKVILYAPKPLNKMSSEDKIRAVYQHCVLRYISNKYMTNESLRKRFGIEQKNYSTASRIIRSAIDAGKIKPRYEDLRANRYCEYVPYWEH